MNEDGQKFADALLSETRTELERADTKAQILLAVSGVAIGVILAALIRGEWTPAELHCLGRWLWWIGVAGATVGLGALAVAVFPRRLKPTGDGRASYFEDIIKFADGDLDRLENALQKEAARGQRTASQLLRLSRVVHEKYKAIQVAMGALGVAIVGCAVGAIIG